MKKPAFPGPLKRGLRRLGAVGLAAGTLWAAVVTAGSDSASAAWAALRDGVIQGLNAVLANLEAVNHE